MDKMRILNSSSFPGLKDFEKKKVNNFLNLHHKEVVQALTYNGRPAWRFQSGLYFFLNEKGKIKEVTIRELTEKGYDLRNRKGYCRFTRWTITKEDMISRMDRENEEALELEQEMSKFWSDKMVEHVGPPASYRLMSLIK